MDDIKVARKSKSPNKSDDILIVKSDIHVLFYSFFYGGSNFSNVIENHITSAYIQNQHKIIFKMGYRTTP